MQDDGRYLELSSKLGRRTAAMHLALGADASDPAFAPEPLTREDIKALSAATVSLASRAFQALDALAGQPGDHAADGQPAAQHAAGDLAEQADRLSGSRTALLDRIRSAPQLDFVCSR